MKMYNTIKERVVFAILNFIEKCTEINQQRKYQRFRKKYKISESFRFNGTNINFLSDGEIICGEESYMGENSSIQAEKGFKVVIGNHCMISHNVRFYTCSAIADQDFSNRPIKEKCGNIIIGNYVWIGTNVMINPGIKIGDNSVIGANSVVTNDVPANSIFGGVPAKLIRIKSYDVN